MQIKFHPYDYDLESIDNFLKRYSLPKREKIKKFLKQLETIERSLSEEDPFSQEMQEKQRSLVKSLKGRCHQMEERRDIIELAEKAEEIANQSSEIPHDLLSKKVKKLKKQLDHIVHNHRPSRTDAKFIQFARACLLKAEKHEPVVLKTKGGGTKKIISLERNLKPASLEDLSLAERLYELAGSLYRKNFKGFRELLETYTDHEKKEIVYHISMMEGDLKKTQKEVDRLKVVRGILGYAHVAADYYLGDTPYPSKQEVKEMFADLEFIESEERSN